MPNRLALAQSLYLRKHQNNPIDWWSWGEEALEEAKTEDKPIFLSIGYSSCHWCTVMEGEAFADDAIAEFMNANFIPIKVDREERPDLDSIYMQALQMMTGQGGWPLNIFLTPDELIPFYGGTYFPVQPRYGRPGFLQILEAVRRFYDVEKEKLQTFTQEIANNLQQSTILPTVATDSLNPELLHRGMEINTAVISPRDLAGPSFPMIPYASLALRGTRFDRQSNYDGSTLSRQRGEDLVKGGIFDHVGGGFHRYTVDSTWTVPHFEKMLYDNGQILEYLANLWSNGVKEPAIQRAVRKTVDWLRREMTAPSGYFYAAQDADSFSHSTAEEPEEGLFYVWNYAELEQSLTSEELAQLQAVFTVTPSGNFEGNNVLQRLHEGELSASLEQILAKLFALRYGQMPTEIDTFPPAIDNRSAKTGNWSGRIPPVTDTKMITAWNSLVISGLARAYSVFGEESYLILAKNAANFILQQQWLDGRFYRLNYDGQPAVQAQAEDYALFIKALLDLQAAVPRENQWLETAVRIQQEFDDLLWSIEMGGYYNNAVDTGKDLLVRERDYSDNAVPSANGVAIANLVRLALLTENLDYLERGERALQAFASVLDRSPQACPSLFAALDWFIYGNSVQTRSQQLLSLVSQYLPTTVYRLATDLPEEATGLVCQASSCLEPAQSSEQLLQQIKEVSC
ncbi:MAG: thioredoxin domain-containing protein [Xenococcaceae cyanobacterium MO_188.B32]|nr:thioredoxin domain-containing protein [Xenococcaceae cyanobacterium MO_188.B32]